MKISIKTLIAGNIITLGLSVFSMGVMYNSMSNTIDVLENKLQTAEKVTKELINKQIKNTPEVKTETKKEESVNKVNNNSNNKTTKKVVDPEMQTLDYTPEDAKTDTQEQQLTSLVTPIQREQEVDLSSIVKNNIKNTETKSDGDVIITLNDDSTILVNKENNEYLFYPAILGDWNYTFKNIGQLNMGVETYLEITPKIERGQAILETNSYIQEDGDLVVEYNDGSWSVINEKENKYIFTPANMGDWDLQVKDKQEFRNVVDTYKELAVK